MTAILSSRTSRPSLEDLNNTAWDSFPRRDEDVVEDCELIWFKVAIGKGDSLWWLSC